MEAVIAEAKRGINLEYSRLLPSICVPGSTALVLVLRDAPHLIARIFLFGL
jgi:hypothetical protein